MPRKPIVPFRFDDKYISALDWLQTELNLPSRAAVVRRAIRLLYKRSKKKSKKKRKRG